MMLRGHFLIYFAFLFLGTGISMAQGDRCSSIQPFCAGDSQLVFENSNMENSTQFSAEVGPNYMCLGTQPFPAWFYLQIAEAGDLEFTIRQSANPDGSGDLYDVDFIVWGPFNEGDDFCSATSLSAQNVLDCSYSPSPVETMTIRNAQQDQIYVVLITNFSSAPGYISLQQTNEGGSTDCSIVGSTLGPDQQICGETPVVLDATNEQASEYRWYLFNEASGAYDLIPGETGPTLTVSETGNYKVTVYSEEFESEASDEVLIEFFDLPEAFEPSPVFGCAQGEDYIFDLTTATEEIIGNRPGNFSVNFYLSEAEIEDGNVIANPENFVGGDGQELVATVIEESTGCESLPVEVSLQTSNPPDLNIDPVTALCVSPSGELLTPVSIGEDLGPDYLYVWSPVNDPDGDGVQNPVFNITQLPQQGIFTLNLINKESGCSISYQTEMAVYAQPASIETEISGSDFEGGYTIRAIPIRGIGLETTYEYRLDNGPWQQDPVFTGVGGGSHRIYAREINGCGDPVFVQIRLIGYPRFFTPNNDGYNDTWNVINDANASIKQVYIFDRFGKLLKEINPASAGWDGTYNGNLMPAADYWFLLKYIDVETGEEKEFKSNFSLIR